MKIDLLRERLAMHRPAREEAPTRERAAVAIVLREGARGAEVLLIERALRDGDPWSGHMAFPGGRLAAEDDSTRSAARRETFEEVGVELADAEHLGRLDDLPGNPRVSPRLVIAAHAFFVEGAPRFDLDPREVQSAFWFPLTALTEPSRRVEHAIPELPDLSFPGILVGQPGRHVVWGLTYRFLDGLFEVLGHPFPDRWGDLPRFDDS
jgi:8-oxo-dGTP pyrophosphatase MutT (NUDIX family)